VLVPLLLITYTLSCTYVLSLACFKLSRNFKPMSVVDSAVSPPAPYMHGRHCQQGIPHCLHMLCAPYLAASRRCLVFARRGSVVCNAARRSTYTGVSRPCPVAHPATRQTPRASLHTSNTMQPYFCAPLGGARTGAFCRFAGRPSPGLSAALPTLRFDALSIFAYSWSRNLSEPISRLSGEF